MKKRQIPHTYVIVFAIIVFCALLTWIVPGGKYAKTTLPDGTETVLYEQLPSQWQSWQVFSALYDGFVDKADIVVFILIIGGAFWIINSSRAIDIGIGSFLQKIKHIEKYNLMRRIGVNNLIMVSIMLVFSLFGAIFGMSEETIAFVIILVPMAISMGYDSITGVCLVFVAAALGFAGAILNPFTIGIAQGLAGIPLFSGIEYRIVCWIVINLFGFTYILRYAARVRRNPQASLVYEEDAYWRNLQASSEETAPARASRASWISFGATLLVLTLFAIPYPLTNIQIGAAILSDIPLLPILALLFGISSWITLRKSVHFYLLNLLFFCVFYLIAGVMGYGWYIREISALFLGLGISAGWACGYSPNKITQLFLEGCKDILSAAMVVGLAGGIIAILNQGAIIDTILYNMAQAMDGLGKVATVGVMYVIQTFINLFIPSGSAKAALTMPIMAPFSELIGISKQATVMAFQFGDGFTNMITPVSGVLIAVLGVARIPYEKWFRWVWKFILLFFVLGFLLLIPTVLLNLNGF